MLSGKLTVAWFDFILITAAAVEEVVDPGVVVPAGVLASVEVEDAIVWVEVVVVTTTLAGGGAGGTGKASGALAQPAANTRTSITATR